ncbi:hypothetical protein DD238_002252 [Peronospora effusa]|uniref:MOSC domain-containing protein n=1 Tax=Peronospora effusa TaxID=542832 RepID=A0A3M6VV25_9STRA|nr:hypothetical protein DD238_002252 [Peronospora effusa]RQM11935.1 hypothetical protein DD237_003092 [Peronospora effusa]
MSYLKQQYHGGGTMQSILAGRNDFVPRGMDNNKDSSSSFADGTQSFMSILSLRHGIEQVEKLGMARILAHTASLRPLLVGRLAALKHWNGRPICVVYGSGSSKTTAKEEGPTVACNFLRLDGSYVGYSKVHKLSEIHNIHLRTGCFCNPGACHHYLGLKESDLMTNIAAGHIHVNIRRLHQQIQLQAYRLRLVLPGMCQRDHTSAKLHYPIKSCSGMVVDAWPIGSRGLLFDREFAIVNLSMSTALTLKAFPKLCFLYPILDLEGQTLTISYHNPDTSTSRQSETSPPSPELRSLPSSFTIPLHAETSITKSHGEDDPRHMRVCADMCRGRNVHADVFQWLNSCLGLPMQRHVPSIGFANQTQYLLISRQSITHFNPVLVAVNSSMSISQDAFQGPCKRCSLINLDPHTGQFRRQLLPSSLYRPTTAESPFIHHFLTSLSKKRVALGRRPS